MLYPYLCINLLILTKLKMIFIFVGMIPFKTKTIPYKLQKSMSFIDTIFLIITVLLYLLR